MLSRLFLKKSRVTLYPVPAVTRRGLLTDYDLSSSRDAHQLHEEIFNLVWNIFHPNLKVTLWCILHTYLYITLLGTFHTNPYIMLWSIFHANL